MKIISTSSSQTKDLGSRLAQEILSRKDKKATVIGLKGDLGGGKTTFTQGFIKGLGIKEDALSPTFVIFRRYEISEGNNFNNFYHFDVYRIKNIEELKVLKFDEIINNPKNILLIEWVDIIKNLIPKESTIIEFKFIDESKREIVMGNIDDIL